MRTGEMRLAAVVLAGLALVGGGGPARAAGKTAAFTVTAVQSSPQGQMTMTSKVWITATQARAEMHHPLGGDMTVLVSNGYIYQLDPKSKRGIKAKLPPEIAKSKDNFDFLVSRMAFNGAPLLKTAKKVRSESVAGYTCDVYSQSVSKQGNSREVTLWMPQKMDPKIAVKAVVTSSVNKPGISAQETLTVSLSDIKVGTAIPASKFAVPAGYKIQEGKVTPPKAPGKK